MNIAKKKILPFHQNIPCIDQVAMMNWLRLLSQSIFMSVKILIVVTISVMYLITTQEHGGYVMIT